MVLAAEATLTGTRRTMVTVLMGFGVAGGACAQTAAQHRDGTTLKHKQAKPTIATLQRDMERMHDQLQSEIDMLKEQLEQRSAQLATARDGVAVAEQQVAAADARTQVVASTAQQTAAEVSTLKTAVEQTRSANEQVVAEVQSAAAETKAIRKAVDEPASFHYRGVTLTPGGFIAAESLWRQRAMNSDVFTPFNNTPYPGAGEAHTSEWVPSARGSRASLLAEGKVPFSALSGYFEGDFFGVGSASNNLQTNSYVLRTRQAWAQVKARRVTFTAGEMWTLMTENRKAAQPGQEALPLNFDYNYTVGLTYLRQPGFRVQAALGPQVTVAVALENSQYQFSASNASANFFFGAVGAAPGLLNPSANYTNQPAPDVLAKVSFDPAFGHFEIGGVARFFRDRYYPTAGSPADAANDTKLGGGFVANARFTPSPKASIGIHLLAGTGTGRYGASLLPDITVHPNGTLAPLRNAQGLVSLEFHPTPRWDIFGYAGTEYVQRTTYRNAAGVLVGYAPVTGANADCFAEALPTSGSGYAPGIGGCLGATRDVTEGQLGWAYRLYSGPKGRVQYGMAYGYVTRTGWVGVGGAPHATNNLVYTSFRYYLP